MLRRLNESRTPVQVAEAQVTNERIVKLIDTGEITQDELNRGTLRAQLKVFGEHFDVPGLGPRSRMPDWTPGLFTDAEVISFDYTGGRVDRAVYDRLSNDVREVHTPKLLRDLHDNGLIDLSHPSMRGVVAVAWTFSEPGSSSGLGNGFWVPMFRRNGFTYLGQPASPPDNAVDVFRGAPEEHRFGMSWTTEVEVARRFATAGMSSRPHGDIYIARVAPEYLLAYINEGHDEYEWVVDPGGLSEANMRRYS